MDRGLRFLCQAETRRLVSFLGITVALVLVVQYSELPYSKLLSSLTTKITSFSMDPSLVNSKLEGDNTHPNGSTSNSSHAFEQIPTSPQASRLDQSRGSVVKATGFDNVVIFNNFTTREASSPMGSVQGKDMNLTAPSSLAPQPMVPMPLPNRTSLDSETDSRSPMVSVTFNATSVKSDTTGPVYKDEKSGSLQGNNLTFSNDKPVTTKNSRKRPSKVVTISEMNLLLKRSQSSSQLVVCTMMGQISECRLNFIIRFLIQLVVNVCRNRHGLQLLIWKYCMQSQRLKMHPSL